MSKWRVPFPKTRPEGGASDVVVAFHSYSGARVEIECVMSAMDAQKLVQEAIEKSRRHGDSKGEQAAEKGDDHG